MIDKGIGSALSGLDVGTAAKAGVKTGKHEDAEKKGGFMDALTKIHSNGNEKGKKAALDGLDLAAKLDDAGDEATPAEENAPQQAAGSARRSQKPIIDIRTVNVKATPAEEMAEPQDTTADAPETVKKRTAKASADMKDTSQIAKTLETLELGETEMSGPDQKAEETQTGAKHSRRAAKSTDDGEVAASKDEASAKDVMSMLKADDTATPVKVDPATVVPQATHEAAPSLLAAAAAKATVAGAESTKSSSSRAAGVDAREGGENAASIDMPDSGEAAEADPRQIFRLSRADGKGQTMEMAIGGGSRRDDRADAEPRGGPVETVTVLESRRYLGLAQNSSSVLNTISGDSEWAKSMHPSSALSNAATMASTGKVVNTLKIQLHPIALGLVTATMRLSGDELTVDLSVETAAAYRQLNDDQKGIVDALRAQGFAVDQVSVTLVQAPDNADTSNSQTGGQNASFGQQAAQDGSGSASSRRDERNAGQQTSRTDATPGEDGSAGGPAGVGGGRPDHVYI